MSEDQSVNSFGDPNAQPPTPKQTPTSAAFPSPIFETPKPPQGSFAESSGQTPRYAEDYSVFNATPGNLRGTQNPFADFISTELIGSSLGHKRLLSAEEIAIEIASRGTFASPYPNARLPPVDPSRRLPSSPAAFVFPKGPSAESELQLSPNLPPHGKSSKKVRRGTLTLPSSEATQVLSPPPSAHKGGKKLAPKANNMQDDQQYGHQDFENLQAHEMAALMGHTDMFGYPMSVSGGIQGAYWDPSAMSMDIDFGVTQTNFFQPTHRHTGSFDWNSEIQLFQDPVPPAPALTAQENVQPARRERALAPKPAALGQMMAPATTAASSAIPGTFTPMDDPFGLMSPIDGVDPGLLYSRPPTSSMNAEFDHIINPGSAEAAVLESHNLYAGGQPRRANSVKDTRKGKIPDRSFTNSPVKSTSRPGLERSMSDNKGRKASGRALPALAPAVRSTPQTAGPNHDTGKAGAKPSGRTSPVKSQRRLSSLASIPESISQPQLVRPRTSVRFTIDAHGRARAETTFLDEAGPSGITRSKSSRELSTRSGWNTSEDESSDEEPIIIPSRTNSFNTSFALPDPRKPVGSIFNPSRRSVSDRSASARDGSRDGSAGPLGEGESETETILTEHEKGGDAASELRKVVQDRQKRSMQMENARSQGYLNTNNLGSYNGSTISPVSLTDSAYGTEGYEIRCVCNKKELDGGNGYMVKCQSCEMLLHGKCVNITRRSMPSVYICGFCANTGTMAGRRVRDTNRGNVMGQASILSPIKNKLYRHFR